ncbi:putative inner membrane protein [Chlamydia psittaci Mat116]|nr:putative inner membrane protein [Chlamydia psittaci Mat116]
MGKRNESGETPVTLWVTQKARAEREVALLHKARIFPDRLSCQPADIFSFVQQTPLKALPAYFLVYTGSSETSCLFVQNGSVLVSRSFGNAQDNCENIVTTLDYVKETYPSIELSAIHTVHIPEGLKKSLENKLSLPLIACQTTTFGLEEEEWANYGDAIITAYHGVSKRTLVLPYNPVFNCAKSQKHWFKRSALVIGKLALLSSAIVGIGSTLKLASLSHRVREHFALACPETPKIPKSLCGLEEALRTAVSSNSHSEYPYLPTIPTSKETMLFLSSMSQNTPSVKLSYFCYSLVSFPSQQNPTLPYKANISVKGEGNPEDVSEFLRKISMHPKLSNIMQTSSSGRTFELQFTIVSQEVL